MADQDADDTREAVIGECRDEHASEDGQRFRNRVASSNDSSCVRSPISASATVESETRKASIAGSPDERATDHGLRPPFVPDAQPLISPMPERPVRNGSRQVCYVRPGRPSQPGFGTRASPGRNLDSR